MMGVDESLRFLLKDLYRYRYLVVTAFGLINIVAVAVGLHWPKTYTASSTIFVEEKNIIQPLMQDAAVATTVSDRAKMARETLFSRRIMSQILESGGWIKGDASDLQKEQVMDAVSRQTIVRNVGKNLVRIEVKDSNPERAYLTTKKFAEVFIAESLGTQTQESEAAFEFIDSQVKEYHGKLTGAEQALKEFRSEHVDARPGTEAAISGKINTLQSLIEKTQLELKEAQIKKASIEKQLSGEAEVTASQTRESQLVSRIAELQGQLDTLRLSYHETYPDIVRLNHQIDELKQTVIAEDNVIGLGAASTHILALL